MLKPSKKSQPKLIKTHKNAFKRSHSVEVLHQKSKGKSQKSLVKSSSTVHQTTFKFFNSSQSKISTAATNKQKSKVKKKFNQKKKPCFKNSKKRQKKEKSQIKLHQFQNEENKQNYESSGSCNNEESWLEKLKKPITQYFLYHDNYIPIENTEQRKIIQRIKLIDLETKGIQGQPEQSNKQQLFLESSSENMRKAEVEFEHQQVMTQIPQLQLKQSQTQAIDAITVQIQTTLSNRNKLQRSVQKIEEPSKCFSNTLMDLQFLFLPDKKNFQSFSEHECQHYRQLFNSLAKKFQKIKEVQQKILPKEQINEQTIVLELYQRECVQMGWTETKLKQGFPTHIFSILSYISNLFCYAQLKEKSSIIAKMNSIYGFPFVERYIRVSKNKITKKFIPVLSDGLYVSLEQQLFANHQFPSDLIEQSVHTHNRMIFDCVNDFLQQFRPFYSIGGQPFPWNNSLGMTFYSIDQESLGLLFNQIKDKIVQTVTYLCGMHLDYSKFEGFDWKKQKNKPYFQNKHSFHIQRIEQQQLKMVNHEIKKIDQISMIEEEYVKTANQISEMVTDQIFQQIIHQLNFMNRSGTELSNSQRPQSIEYGSDFEEQE